MTIQQAVEKAIEGGYDEWKYASPRCWSYEKIILDPSFWQCLAKSMGWRYRNEGKGVYMWLDEWHRFTDHRAEGKSIESFFEQL